jgi:hypothetical protein
VLRRYLSSRPADQTVSSPPFLHVGCLYAGRSLIAGVCSSDETLAAWWTTFNARNEPRLATHAVKGGSTLHVNGTQIQLHRTLRVPDDGKAHKLPPVSHYSFPVPNM